MDALRADLKKVQSAAAVPALDVQIERCQSFIARSQRRLPELDGRAFDRSQNPVGEVEVGSRAVSGNICKTPNRVRSNRWFRRSAKIAADGGRTPIEIEFSGHSEGHCDAGCGTQQETFSRGLCPRLCRRPRSVDVRSSERLAGGDGERENPRCPQIGKVGRRRRRPVEGVTAEDQSVAT